jgi:hypothetical protein
MLRQAQGHLSCSAVIRKPFHQEGRELSVIAEAKACLTWLRPSLLFAAMVSLTGCTFIGFDNAALRDSIDWGSEQSVPTCVYLDDGVSKEDADRLLGWWNKREANWYKLEFVPASYEQLKRQSDEFFFFQIAEELMAVKRPDRCLKQIWFVSRKVTDAIYGGAANVLGLPEVVGWTDDQTRTKAWSYADATPDLNQFVMSPGVAIRHEMYHLLGCDHFDVGMSHCYQAIREFKAREREYLNAPTIVNTARASKPGRNQQKM